VDLRDQAVDIAEHMGIMPQVRAAAADVQGMKFVDAEDRTIARIDTTGASEAEIMRGDLVALLHQAAGPGVEYVFGDSIRQLEQDSDGVTVSFDHAGTRRFDLVIGADGLHSTVRRLAFGPESDYVRHKGLYGAFANADAALGENRWVTMYNLPGKMAGITAPATTPRPRRSSSSAPAPWPTTTATPGSTSACSATPSRANPRGRSKSCSPGRWPIRTSTSTRSARCTWTPGSRAGWRWWATPPGAPHPPRARARSWP
jgi:2-polyprenyl-6-methoxyphenol hydroxylase-like FAD-dependent oxidoreductase